MSVLMHSTVGLCVRSAKGVDTNYKNRRAFSAVDELFHRRKRVCGHKAEGTFLGEKGGVET